MSQDKIKRITDAISTHPDFPKPGIDFKNIFPILRDPALFKDLVDIMVDSVRTNAQGAQLIVGLEARGFVFGPIIAQALGIGFVPIRKAGKLPGETHRVTYTLEYGQDSFEIEKNAMKTGEKVVIVDDLLATGGTMKAACDLISKAGGEVQQCLVVIELEDLHGREKFTEPCTMEAACHLVSKAGGEVLHCLVVIGPVEGLDRPDRLTAPYTALIEF